MLKITICLITVLTLSLALNCSESATKLVLKKPIYEFSVNLLERVAFEARGHFVFSPLSTWLQLISLAEGAKSQTLQEIWKVTGLRGYKRKSCYRRQFKEIFNKMEENMKNQTQRSLLIIIDKFYDVKQAFKNEVESLHSAKVVSLNFDNAEQAAQDANDIIEEKLQGNLETVIMPNDFDKSFLIMNDAAYVINNWKYPFNKAYTKTVKFLSNEEIEIGNVNMMNQVGYFRLVDMPIISATVLDLPCENQRISMLLFLPKQTHIEDLFYQLKQTTLTGILNVLKLEEPKSVNVSIPAFSIETEIPNVQELLYDMGLKKALYPEQAQLKGISDYTICVSLIAQAVGIEVTETGVNASARSEIESLVMDPAVEFNANKPFAFMIVDKEIEGILFAGIFSDPMKELS